MILFLFFCSGATALVYEVVWSKYLSLMLGSTVQAQTVVLAVFMGGLALGNRLIGARSDLLQKPLAAYGCLEVVIGLYAFFFGAIYSGADKIFIAAGTPLFENHAAMFLLKSAFSIGLLIVPTILMGGTLPLLAAWLQKQSDDAGRWSARFYSTNSLGAVCGSCLAGFFLIRSMGMVATLQGTALANVIIGFIAIGIGRRQSEGVPVKDAAKPAEKISAPGSGGTLRWVTLLVALTGGVSMGLEVLASRSLSLIFGASLQAFAIVLMAFILGIGLGSATVASPRLKRWRNESAVVALLLVAATIIAVLVLGIEWWVIAYRHVRVGLAPTPMGYRFYQFITGGFAMVVLGLPAALIGAVLPLCIRWASEGGVGLGGRVGRLLTWNTLGAVVGVLLTGFVLMPRLGLRNAFNALALALCVPAMLLAWKAKRRVFILPGAALVALLLYSSASLGEGWRHVFSSGVYRARETFVDPRTLELRKKQVKILFYEDAADATVTVESQGEGDKTELGLRINGKPEASSLGDLSTQLLLAHLPMLMRPESKDVFMLGLASGISCRGLLAYPIEKLTVAENCAPVPRACAYFTPWNRGVLTNPVTKLRIEDARAVLKLDPQTYDVVICEPSNPWFASVGSVFSREFYQIAQHRLKPGGLMVQWFHVYEMHDGIVEMVLRTFSSVFPIVEIWDANGGDLILIGSDRPWDSSADAFRKSFARPLVLEDLMSIGLGTPEALMARQFASQRTGFAITGPGPVQSDGFPILEYDAPMAFFIGGSARRFTRFDERTWQRGLASAQKLTQLAGFDDATLRKIFARDTVNGDLWKSVAERLRAARDAGKGATPVTNWPCVFAPPPQAEAEFPPAATEGLKNLIRARIALENGTGRWPDDVKVIRSALLAQFSAGFDPKAPQTTATHYAAVAARECIARHDPELAGQLLKIGRAFSESDEELAYLGRILEREAAPVEKTVAR